MEGAGQSPPAPGAGPSTSTPNPPAPPRPNKIVSSLSLNSESSEEDWLIKVCCPGAHHRRCKNAKFLKPPKTALDKEDELAGCTPNTSYQAYPGIPRKASSDLQWLMRLRCPKAQMEQKTGPKQSLPAVSSSLSTSPSKTRRDSLLGRGRPSEAWLTQKHLSALQAVVSEQQAVGSTYFQMERENCFVREVDRYLKHNDFLALRRKEMQYKKWFETVSSPLLQKIQDKVDNQTSEEIEGRKRKQLSLYLNYCNQKQGAYLESYNPSMYDPFFLKTCTDVWKVSLPPLSDPLLKEVEGRYLEEAIIQQCNTGRILSSREISELSKADLPLLPWSRQIMNPEKWLRISSGYIESEIHQRSRRKMCTTRNKSTMDFNCWGDPTWLLPTRRSSLQKLDIASESSLLAKEIPSSSSVWKSAIKSAS